MLVVYAGFWRRAWALLLDLIFVLLVWGLIDLITGGNRAGAILGVFVIVYLVGLTMEGGTVGKRALALRVVATDGTGLGLGRALLRELIGRPLSLLGAGLGFLWMIGDPQRQTWHDKIASSVVVRELSSQVAPTWQLDPPWRRKRGSDPPQTAG